MFKKISLTIILTAVSTLLFIGLAIMFVAGCNGSNSSTSPSTVFDKTYQPIINPANFVAAITNQFFPLTPGTTFIYEGEEDGESERNEVYVTHETKEILGVTCIVVQDRVWVEGDLEEETFDWYAQDTDGNVWYFGEDSREMSNGVVVSTEGSWEAGVDGAQPGIIMQANPQVGDSYRQEYYWGEAEDWAEVVSLSESVTVPYGFYTNCLQTKEWTPLEPGVTEHKYYAPGVGVVLEVTVEGGKERVELINITTE
jgi:hypothetical protein